MTQTLPYLQGVDVGNKLRAIKFKVSNPADRRCVEKLDELAASFFTDHGSDATLTASSSDDNVNLMQICRQMDQIVASSRRLSEPQKFELRNFLAKQQHEAKKASMGLR